ncbi:DedA family protein [Clostridium mobile]|uniref:DedA family protein n=1 Tax=Clostridium mobile TaxID=2841512 RepID=UPI001FE7CAB2|nr:DedA family protein [Clostridium mobile]
MSIIYFLDIIINNLMQIIGQIGYLGIVIIIGLEYACFPMPSEVVLPFIGMTATQNNITYLGALLASIIGGLLGSSLCYAVGYYGGSPLIEKIEKKFPKTKKSIDAINKWFEKYGKASVFLARLLPLTRTYISIVAGAVKLNISTYLIYSVAGIVIWNSILISLGYFIGDNWDYIQLFMKQYSIIASIILIAIVIAAIYIRKKNIKANKDKSYTSSDS